MQPHLKTQNASYLCASASVREIIIFTSSPKYKLEHNQAIPEHAAQNLYYS